ncbi:MAG: DUF11 domain-containing protein [Chloroflexi bacterium]|nr:DUF11 domain-containing protein [Chloroflexota bacterium]
MKIRRMIRLALAAAMPAAMLLFVFWQAQAWMPLPANQTTAVSLPLISQFTQTDKGVSFVLHTAVFQSTADGQISVGGLEDNLSIPNAPILPYYTTFIAVPPGAAVSIRVEPGQTINQQMSAPVPTAAEPFLAFSNDEQNSLLPDTPADGALSEWVPETGYSPDDWFPTAVYQLSEPVYYRDMRLAQLQLFPLRYRAADNQMAQTTELRVFITFDGATENQLRPLAGDNDAYYQTLRQDILNFDQGKTWRSLPETALDWTGPGLPLDTDTYKIHVDSDGLYAITGAELAAAGMNLAQIDPNTIQMMHRGQPVAYQFIGDPNNGFQPGDAVRFYGATFTGPRLETQFVGDNIYWLWGGGTPTPITQRANTAGQGQPVVTTFRSTITREPENVHHSTWTNQWNQYPNEPDAWYWERVTQNVNILTRTYPITLPHPALTGASAYYEVELLPREANTSPTNFLYDVRATINNYPVQGQVTWQRLRSINVTGTQPITTLLAGVNTASVIFATDRSASPGDPIVFLNRISVSYDRRLTADNNQLLFDKQNNPGVQQFEVNNFSQNQLSQILVWDISDPLRPEQINLSSSDISGSGPYTYTFTGLDAADGRYLATTSANVRSVKQISQYIPHSLQPAGGADWIAISHNLFITEAQRLAAHRADPQFGGLAAHVVDINDLINQFGYGLPLPESIRHYLGYALATWPTAPSYVVLVGGGTINPRNLPCPVSTAGCRAQWDPNQPNFVLTDIVFTDRFQGAVPSDHTFVTLIGDDLAPDIAIGRLVANTTTEANAIVSKIIRYDQNLLTPADPQRHLLFVADNADTGGNFCLENTNLGANLPPSLLQSHVCLDVATEADTNRVRDEMKSHIDSEGVNILNYRGHGGVQFWASPPIFNVNPLSGGYAGLVYITTTTPISGFWANVTRPLIIISADCLDGHFGFPGEPALSRTFMAMGGVGAAAHWSSTGLGFTSEHTVLLNNLYAGAFELGLPSLGQAINHAKMVYYTNGQHPSELYSFTLQGDPAMQLYRPDLNLEKSSPQSALPVYPGDAVTFHLTVQNNGLYASSINLTDSLPEGLIYQTYSASVPVSLTITGNELNFRLDTPLAWHESAAVTVTAVVTNGVDGLVTNSAAVQSAGWDLNPTDNEASASILIRDSEVRLSKSSPQSGTALYPGDEAIFQLVVGNNSIYTNTITLTDSLPLGLAYRSYSATAPVSLTLQGSNLTFVPFNPLSGGESITVTITTQVTGSAVGLLTNTAVAEGAAGDLDEANASVMVYYLNMRLEKSSPQSNTPLYPGDEAVFHLAVYNEGIHAGHITLTDTLPSGLQYRAFSASVPVSLTVNGQDLTFTLDNPLTSGESVTVTLTTDTMDNAVGVLTNTAIITNNDWILNPQNQQASASVQVLPTPPRLVYLPVVIRK